MRSDEVGAAWGVLSPVLDEMNKKNIGTEVYDLGSRGPDKAIYLWAKHGVQWLDEWNEVSLSWMFVLCIPLCLILQVYDKKVVKKNEKKRLPTYLWKM